jgi:hypothetical protein
MKITIEKIIGRNVLVRVNVRLRGKSEPEFWIIGGGVNSTFTPLIKSLILSVMFDLILGALSATTV